MATVRELVVALGLDFDAGGFAKADAAIRVLRTGFLGVGAVITGAAAALTGITVAVARSADHMNDFAQSIGVSAEAVQKLGYAAQLSGSSADTLRTGLTFLARQAQAASEGSTEASENFAKFGVRLHETGGGLKTADRLLLDIAKGMEHVKNPTERAALAAQLLGRSAGPQLVQLLAQGEDGIGALGDELEALGGLMDQEFIEASAALADTLDRMQFVVKGVGVTIARAFLPAVQGVTRGIIEWWKANRRVVDNGLVFFVQRMMSAFSGIAGVLRAVTSAFGQFVDDLGPVGRVMVVLAGAALTMALAFASPAGAVLVLSGLVLALADDINEFVEGGESVLGDFVDFMIDWGKQNGGVLGDFIADVGRFLKDFQGAGWGEVVKEVDAHFKILANTLNSIWSVMQKIAAGARLLFRSLVPETETITDREGLLRRQAERQAAQEADIRTLGGGKLIDAGRGIDSFLNGLLSTARAKISGADASVNAFLGTGPTLAQQTANTTNVGGSKTTNVEAQINITAAPGQNTEEIGKVVRAHIEDMRDAELTAAHAALVPGQ